MQEVLLSNRIIQHIIVLFFQYDLNNILHNVALRMIFWIIEDKNMVYLEHILAFKLIDNLINFCCESDKKKQRRKGNIGHIIMICNKIN